MGNRRMMSKTVTQTQKFLKLPLESQALYFHLLQCTDDDGIVEAFPIIRMIGAKEEDIDVLVDKGMIKPLNDEMVYFLYDFSEQNTIKADRYKKSKYALLLDVCLSNNEKEIIVDESTGEIIGKISDKYPPEKELDIKQEQEKNIDTHTEKELQEIKESEDEKFISTENEVKQILNFCDSRDFKDLDILSREDVEKAILEFGFQAVREKFVSANKNKESIKSVYDFFNIKCSTEVLEVEDAKENIDYKSIVGYLNEKADTSYRSTSKETQKWIKARISEGFELEDFRKVIDNKISEWKNTDMEKFIRPQTLFSNKFESYLNQKPVKQKQEERPSWHTTMTDEQFEEAINNPEYQL